MPTVSAHFRSQYAAFTKTYKYNNYVKLADAQNTIASAVQRCEKKLTTPPPPKKDGWNKEWLLKRRAARTLVVVQRALTHDVQKHDCSVYTEKPTRRPLQVAVALRHVPAP